MDQDYETTLRVRETGHESASGGEQHTPRGITDGDVRACGSLRIIAPECIRDSGC